MREKEKIIIAMTLHNVSHLFQRCQCKMMSVSETGIHMMKAHETMECMLFFFFFWRRGFSVSSPAHCRHGHKTVHAVFMHLAIDLTWMQEKGEKPIRSLAVTLSSFVILSSGSDDRMRRLSSSHFYLYDSASMGIWWMTHNEAVYAFTNDHACKPAWLNHLVCRNNVTKKALY